MRERPVVLYVMNGLVSGGAEHGLLTLVEHGFFSGVDLHVFLFMRGDEELAERLLRAVGRDRVSIVDDGAKLTSAILARGARRLLSDVRRLQPDAAILSLKQANIVGRSVLALAPGVRCIAFEHIAQLEAGRLRPAYETLLRALSGRVQEVWADCRETLVATRRYYRGGGRDEAVIPLFVADPAVAKSDYGRIGPLRLVTAGRLIPRKRQRDILAAMRDLADRGIATTLDVYGTGPDLEALRVLAGRHGLSEAVDFKGYVGHWSRTATDADAFVHVSEEEGFCIVAAEAMAAGLPCVLTPVGGIPEYSAHGCDCLHVRPGAVADLAVAIERLAGSEDLRQALGRSARDTILRRFGPGTMPRFASRLAGGSARIDAALPDPEERLA